MPPPQGFASAANRADRKTSLGLLALALLITLLTRLTDAHPSPSSTSAISLRRQEQTRGKYALRQLFSDLSSSVLGHGAYQRTTEREDTNNDVTLGYDGEEDEEDEERGFWSLRQDASPQTPETPVESSPAAATPSSEPTPSSAPASPTDNDNGGGSNASPSPAPDNNNGGGGVTVTPTPTTTSTGGSTPTPTSTPGGGGGSTPTPTPTTTGGGGGGGDTSSTGDGDATSASSTGENSDGGGDGDGGLSAGAIAGIVIGGVAVLLGIVAAIIIGRRRRSASASGDGSYYRFNERPPESGNGGVTSTSDAPISPEDSGIPPSSGGIGGVRTAFPGDTELGTTSGGAYNSPPTAPVYPSDTVAQGLSAPAAGTASPEGLVPLATQAPVGVADRPAEMPPPPSNSKFARVESNVSTASEDTIVAPQLNQKGPTTTPSSIAPWFVEGGKV